MLERKFSSFVACCVMILIIMTGIMIYTTDRLNKGLEATNTSMDELTRALDELDKAVGGTNEEIKPVAP